jgi:lipopolysaccharide transport system permease protein
MNASGSSPFAAVDQLFRHRALLSQFTRRNIELRHRGSFLGLTWTILTPLISLTIYTFVFGFVFNGRFTNLAAETNLDYALGVFLGLVLFNFLAEVLAQSPTVIISQPNFVKKVVFPLEVLPAAAVGSAAFAAILNLALALIGVAVFGSGLDWHALELLLIVPPVVLIALGCAWFFSAVGVFIRDVGNAMPFVVQIIVYISAVFYPIRLLDKLPLAAHKVLLANPLLHAVESARQSVLWHQGVQPSSIVFLWGSGIAIFAIGYFTFAKLRSAFADVI